MKTVLVVDDHPENRYLLQRLLQGHGFAVDEARHGAEALVKARQARPDLVISDLLMPVMDGYSLLREWKGDTALRSVPFIVYTATYTDPKDEQLALDLGADAFIIKPAEPGSFVQDVLRVLKQAEQGELAPPRKPIEDKEQTLQEYNAALVHKLEQKAQQLEQRIQEREHALQALNDSEAQFRALVDHSSDMILQTSPDGRIHSANPAACRAFGMSEAQIRAAGREGLFDTSDPRLAELLRIRAEQGHVSGELTLRRSDGSCFPAEGSSTLYRDALGVQWASLTMRDITDRKRAEQALKASYARVADLQSALDAHALVSMTNADGRITYVNDRYCQITGYSRAELVGQNHRLIRSGLHPDAFYDDMWATVSSGKIWQGEVCSRRKDGGLFWVDATLVPLLDDEGRPYQYVGIRSDISKRKRAEAAQRELEGQLREAQKLQAVGTLAGGIAHDFNNIVGAILGYVALARGELPAAGPAADYLAQIQIAGQRARSLVQRILTFSRPQPTALENIALQPLIHETLAIVRATLPRVVTLETRLPEAPLHVLADGTQLQQVLLNLCTNAWHALGGSTGRIEIGLDIAHFDASTPQRPHEMAPGEYLHLWVNDNGCGMDEATRARIFEPFFTTKPVGQGTGLGLAAVRGIVGAHHGAITVDSKPGLGSTFHLYLPGIAPEAAGVRVAAEAGPAVQRGKGQHVLYLDDDETLVHLAEIMLSRAGYRVSVFDDAELALTAVRMQPQGFDLVVTDYNMPRLTGLDVATELRAVRADLPVILSSGHIDARVRDEATRLGVRALLNKERMAEELVPMVRRALAGEPALD